MEPKKCELDTCMVIFTPRSVNNRFHEQECKDKWHQVVHALGVAALNSRKIKGKYHLSRIENSPRLQKVARLLSDGKPHTTKEIVNLPGVCNVYASELRANGFTIITDQIKKDRWEYTMTGGFENLKRIPEWN